MSLVKSKERVAEHGEVFTPPWMVEAMLDLVRGETERIDARFLEPACGSGNFLVPILRRKLATVLSKYGDSDYHRRYYALLAVMNIYGIELLADNIAECRANLLAAFAEVLELQPDDDLLGAASYVLSQNLVHGDAREMRTHTGEAILFAEWGPLGAGKYQRRDFRLATLTGSAEFSKKSTRDEAGSLFADLGKDAIFTPEKDYPPISMAELAKLGRGPEGEAP